MKRISNLVLSFALAMLMMLSIGGINVAMATDTTSTDTDTSSNSSETTTSSVVVYKDGVQVQTKSVTIIGNEVYFIPSVDLFVLFEDEAKDYSVTQSMEAVKLSTWAEEFDYTVTVDADKKVVRIEKNTFSTSGSSVKVYVNGKVVQTKSVTIIGDKAYFVPADDVKTIFGDDAGKLETLLVNSTEIVNLWTVADKIGYNVEIFTASKTVKITKKATEDTNPESTTNDATNENESSTTENQSSTSGNESSTPNNTNSTTSSSNTNSNNDNSAETSSSTSGGSGTNSVSGVNINIDNSVTGSGVTINNSTLDGTNINNTIDNSVNVTINQVDSHTEEGQRADMVGGTDVQYKATVFVNGSEVKGSRVFLDQNKLAWLYPATDLYLLFPDESFNFVFTEALQPELLSSWCKMFGYTMEVTGLTVDLTKDGAETTKKQNAVLIVNGLLVEQTNLTFNGKTIEFDTVESAKQFFSGKYSGEEKKGKQPTSTSLADWAYYNNYNMETVNDHVYLNNNGKKPVEVYLDDELVEFPDQWPIIENNRTYVPLRALCEAMDWEVAFNDGEVMIKSGNTTIILYIGSGFYMVNGVSHTTDASPKIINNRTMVGVRFLTEAVGCNVSWDGSGTVGAVMVTKP